MNAADSDAMGMGVQSPHEPQLPGEVVLAEGRSGLQLLYEVIAAAKSHFSSELGDVTLPDNFQKMRGNYCEVVAMFEAARLASEQRFDIAKYMAECLQKLVVWRDAHGERSLVAELDRGYAEVEFNLHDFPGETGWQPTVNYRGELWSGEHLTQLGKTMLADGMITAAAAAGFARMAETLGNARNSSVSHATQRSLDLSDRRIVVLGAGAEMAPTELWLQAGADVLWLDTVPPPAAWLDSKTLSGRLYWPKQNIDLLTQPQQAMASIITFAGGGLVDIGLYAYAPGRGREIRLTQAMNTIIDSLPRDIIGSITMLVSPTTPTHLSSQDVSKLNSRIAARPWWQKLLAGVGLLGKDNAVFKSKLGGVSVSHSGVSIQGASYQAAQYLGKVIYAENWADRGQIQDQQFEVGQLEGHEENPEEIDETLILPKPLRVSANTAAITRTASLAHPLFLAAFVGASHFSVETLSPEQSRTLNGLLAVRDWLDNELPRPGAVRVHGGIHTMAQDLESALRVAAVIGFVRSPKLLLGLLR